MHICTLTKSGVLNELAETVVKEAATAATAAKRSFMVLRLRIMNLCNINIEYVVYDDE